MGGIVNSDGKGRSSFDVTGQDKEKNISILLAFKFIFHLWL